MTVDDILAVMKDMPALTHYGFGAYRGSVRSFEEYVKAVEAEKVALIGAVDQCNKACMYIQHLEKRKAINGRVSTYGFKHGVENYLEHLGIIDNYVSNGAFICAARFMGFRVEQGINGSANGYINYGSRSPMVRWSWLSGEIELSAKQMRELNRLEQELGLPLSVKEGGN